MDMTPQSELSAQSRDTSAAESEFTATGWVARVDQWYMSKPFAIKTKIATALGVGGLVLVALIAVIGLMNPQYSTNLRSRLLSLQWLSPSRV